MVTQDKGRWGEREECHAHTTQNNNPLEKREHSDHQSPTLKSTRHWRGNPSGKLELNLVPGLTITSYQSYGERKERMVQKNQGVQKLDFWGVVAS